MNAEVKIDELSFVMKGGNDSTRYLKDKLFTLSDGTDVYSGDTVEWSINKPFNISGIVENVNGLKVACFNTLLNKWKYYSVVT
jgi:hypothetical protein